MSIIDKLKTCLQRFFQKKCYGHIHIPLLHISVPLFLGDDLQSVVDDEQSAVIFQYGKMKVIADHAYQNNFKNLNCVQPGMLASIMTVNGKKEYRCTETMVGHLVTTKNGTKIRDDKYNYIFTHDADLCIYTCRGKSADNIMDIRLTFWKEV